MGRLTLQFSTEDDPLSWMIREFSRGDWSHVDGVMPDGSLLGARLDGGVAIRPAGYANFSRIKTVSIITDTELIYTAARAQLGKPYDLEAISAFAFNRNWRDDGRWFCSELWAYVLEQVYWTNRLSAEVSRITPRDLDLVLSPFANG